MGERDGSNYREIMQERGVILWERVERLEQSKSEEEEECEYNEKNTAR
jgi:hypothetical protein